MTPSEVRDYYKNGYQFYKETGMSAASLGNWVRWGYIPIASQFKIQDATDNNLKADWKDTIK